MDDLMIYLLENSTNITIYLSLFGAIIWALKNTWNHFIDKKVDTFNIVDLFQIVLGISTLIWGLLLVCCSMHKEYISKLPSIEIYLLIAGFALIYVSFMTIFNGNNRRKQSQQII